MRKLQGLERTATNFKWWMIGILTVISLGTASAMFVGGELESALLEKLASDPTGNEAQLYYNTTTKKARLYNGTAWTALGGGGAGEINYNDDADGTGNWTELGDGITVSTTTTEAEVPRWPIKTQAVLLTNDTSGTSGFSVCVEVGEADRNKKLKIEWAQIVSTSPAYASGEFTYQLFSETNDTCTGTETGITLHSVGATTAVDIPAQNGVMYDEFDATDAQYYELKFVRASGASASTVGINDLVIGPGKLHSGAVVTAWEEYTPTLNNMTANSTDVFWRRVGSQIEIYGVIDIASVTTGNASFDLPSGLTFQTTETSIEVGTVICRDVSAIQHYRVSLFRGDSNSIGVAGHLQDGTTITTSNDYMDSTSPFTWASGDLLRGIWVTAEIAEWQNAGVLNTIVQDNLTEWQTEDAEDFLDNTGGGFDSGSMRWRQVGDSMEIQFKERSNLATGSGNLLLTIPGGYSMPTGNVQFTEGSGWFFDDSASQMNPIWPAYDTSTTIRFNFKTAAGAFDILDWTIFADNDVISANIIVPITEWAGSQSSLVGFSEVSQDFSGLVQSAGQLKGTNTNDSAAAGYVGEYLSENPGADVTATCGSYVEVDQITLTAGDWDVTGMCVMNSGGTNVTMFAAVVGQSTATASGALNNFGYHQIYHPSGALAFQSFVQTGPRRITVSAGDGTDIIYLNCYIACSTAADWDVNSRIQARRVR